MTLTLLLVREQTTIDCEIIDCHYIQQARIFESRIDFAETGQFGSSTEFDSGSKYINLCFYYHTADRAKKNPALLQVAGLVIKQSPVPD